MGALETVKQPLQLVAKAFLGGDCLEMGAILPRQPQQLKLKPQLLVGVAFWVGVSLVADANRKPLQPPRQRQRLPPQQLLPLQQLPQPNVEVLLVVVYWAAKHFIQCYNEQVLF